MILHYSQRMQYFMSDSRLVVCIDFLLQDMTTLSQDTRINSHLHPGKTYAEVRLDFAKSKLLFKIKLLVSTDSSRK